MTKYFSFCDDESVAYLGEFEDIEEAIHSADNLPLGVNSIWVFREQGLRDLMVNIKEVLNENC